MRLCARLRDAYTILRAHEKFVFGVWVKATDDDDILAVAYNMVMVPSSN